MQSRILQYIAIYLVSFFLERQHIFKSSTFQCTQDIIYTFTNKKRVQCIFYILDFKIYCISFSSDLSSWYQSLYLA